MRIIKPLKPFKCIPQRKREERKERGRGKAGKRKRKSEEEERKKKGRRKEEERKRKGKEIGEVNFNLYCNSSPILKCVNLVNDLIKNLQQFVLNLLITKKIIRKLFISD